VPKRT